MSAGAVQSKRPEAWGWFLGLALLTFAVFAPSIGFDYVDLEDPQYVLANPRVVAGLLFWVLRHATGATRTSASAIVCRGSPTNELPIGIAQDSQPMRSAPSLHGGHP